MSINPEGLDPYSLFLTTVHQGIREELEASQQRSDSVPEQRQQELWNSYQAGMQEFQSHPTRQGLEQQALRYGRYLYWEERESPQFGPDLAELGAAIRDVAREKGIIEEFEWEFEQLSEGL